MGHSEFLRVADCLPEAMLLVSVDGGILAANRAARRRFQEVSQNLLKLSIVELTHSDSTHVKAVLRACARTRAPVPLALKFPAGDRRLVSSQCEGFLYSPSSATAPAQILLRFVGVSGHAKQFLSLNEEITKQRKMLRELERSREALAQEHERAIITLHSIGDAVITTDRRGIVEYLNPVAENLTGWSNEKAKGRALSEVFIIVDEFTHAPAENPIERCLREGIIVGLANHTLLISREGREVCIDDSAAPICDARGNIFGVVLVFNDVTRTRELTARLNYQANHDGLTGLINRREFERRTLEALKSAIDRDAKHAMLYIDLDQFKIVNDTSGHIAGDELLRQISSLLGKPLRESDTLARLGGDEFGVLLENCSLEKAANIAESLRALIGGFRFVWQEQTFDIGASVGVVPINAKSDSFEQIMSAADMACYAAKDGGRDRVHIAHENDVELEQRKGELRWLPRLQCALKEERLVLFYQAIHACVNPGDGCAHFEILLRMCDEDGRLIMPGAFIPAAERYNLMPTIDLWVIQAAFKMLHSVLISKELADDNKLTINLSGASLNNEHLVNYVLQLQHEYNVIPQSICFEITETTAIANLVNATQFIKGLKKEGYFFALDDFGSGLCSFAYLKNLPVDYLKIDGAFVRDMAYDPINCAVVKSINEIGHAMGIKTVAECVESEDTLMMLRDIGVDFAQGYYVHTPAPLNG